MPASTRSHDARKHKIAEHFVRVPRHMPAVSDAMGRASNLRRFATLFLVCRADEAKLVGVSCCASCARNQCKVPRSVRNVRPKGAPERGVSIKPPERSRLNLSSADRRFLIRRVWDVTVGTNHCHRGRLERELWNWARAGLETERLRDRTHRVTVGRDEVLHAGTHSCSR